MSNTLDEAEHRRLQEALTQAEKFLVSHQSDPLGTVASQFQPMAQRVDALEQSGVLEPASEEKRKPGAMAQAVAVAALVAKETALSHEERQTYAGFLRQDYFTRSDFDELEAFYSEGWERLSEDGKRQMSERFWAGVERGEYTVQEAPEAIRRRELDQLAMYLENPEKAPPRISNLSPEIRDEFLREYRAGNIAQAEEVLFGEDLFVKQPKGVSQPDSVRSAESGARGENDSAESKEVVGLAELGQLSPIPLESQKPLEPISR